MRLFTDVASRIDDPFLARAYSLAEEGRGTTSPNPVVGCVIVRDGVVVGEGFHVRAGEPHAEVLALRAAGDAARGATAYVTLEPCDHFGRTPPCSQALIDAGVAACVIGMPDPSSIAAGGAARLRAAGIDTRFASDPVPFEELNEAWLHFERTGLPYVNVKTALSLDGHTSIAPGVRTAVSGSGGARIMMRLRAAADAVLVGASTARSDDPALTVRDPATGDVLPRQPLRVVLGREGVPDASLFHDCLGDAVALVPDRAEVPEGVSALRYRPTGDSTQDLRAAMTALGSRGVRRVMVEAGPGLFTALWNADLIDELVLVHGGGVFGEGASALFLGRDEGRGADTLDIAVTAGGSHVRAALAHRMEAVEAGIIEGDAITVWRPVQPQGARKTTDAPGAGTT